MLLLWGFYLFKYSDKILLLEKYCANIYIKGNEKIEFAEAGSILKKGEWIIVNRNLNGFEEEIRIKESDIVRIDYFGAPLIIVDKPKLLKKK